MGNHLKPGSGHGSLADRVAATKARQTGPMERRHVIVKGVAGETEGLLVEWHQRDGEWWARVIYTAEVRAGRRGVVDEWVPAADVRPA